MTPNPSENPFSEFEISLSQVEQLLSDLQQRYAQILQAREQQTQLQQDLERIQKQSGTEQNPGFERDLREIQEKLQELAITLESELLTDSDLKRLFWQGIRQGLLGEIFWQIVRFGGLGVVLGWILRSCTR